MSLLVQALRLEAAACAEGASQGSPEWREGMRLLGGKLTMAADRIEALEAALKELLDSMEAQIPPFEAGKAAQDAWADRRAKARDDAAFLLTR